MLMAACGGQRAVGVWACQACERASQPAEGQRWACQACERAIQQRWASGGSRPAVASQRGASQPAEGQRWVSGVSGQEAPGQMGRWAQWQNEKAGAKNDDNNVDILLYKTRGLRRSRP